MCSSVFRYDRHRIKLMSSLNDTMCLVQNSLENLNTHGYFHRVNVKVRAQQILKSKAYGTVTWLQHLSFFSKLDKSQRFIIKRMWRNISLLWSIGTSMVVGSRCCPLEMMKIKIPRKAHWTFYWTVSLCSLDTSLILFGNQGLSVGF